MPAVRERAAQIQKVHLFFLTEAEIGVYACLSEEFFCQTNLLT
jgi:hypothetical protein